MSLIKIINPEDVKGRVFVCGDLHGCFSKLMILLRKSNFKEEEDILIATGDLIDRGLESHRCLEFLSKPWFYSVKGNHEDMFMGVLDRTWDIGNYIYNGGKWSLKLSNGEKKELYDAFSQLPLIIQFGDIAIIHSEASRLNWNEIKESINSPETQESILWGRERIGLGALDPKVEGIGLIIHGHTIGSSPVMHGNHLCIDTGAFLQNRELTLLELNDEIREG